MAPRTPGPGDFVPGAERRQGGRTDRAVSAAGRNEEGRLGGTPKGRVMTSKLNILHLEDDPNDAMLIRETLRDEGVDGEIRRVTNRDDYVTAIQSGSIDLILSDFALPQFDGLTALGLARTLAPDTPFILVSGTMGEDAAVDSLRSGATDYVLKMRLSRLAPAVRRAVEESRERRGRRTMEQELERERNFLRTLLDSLDSGVLACD